MDWVATVGVLVLWAVFLAVLLIGLNYALHGLTWCSVRSLRRLHGARYVAERIVLSDRIQCDGGRLWYAPRASAAPPKLCFGHNIAGWAPGVLTPEASVRFLRDEISRRSIVLGMVIGALSLSWLIVLFLYPGAADSFVSLVRGSPIRSAGGPMFAVLLLLSMLFLIHTIHPFRFTILPQFGLSPKPTRGGVKGAPDAALVDFSADSSTKRARERQPAPETPDNFIGSQETLEDLDRFCPLQRHALGPRNESVFIGRYYRSLTLFHLKRYENSLSDLETYVKALSKELGERNSWTLKVRHLKAVNLASLGNWPSSLAELDIIVALYADVFGPSHPDTLMTRSARVTAWAMLERHADVVQELDTLLPECEAVLGPDDYLTASNVRLKGIALQKLEGAPEAVDKAVAAAVSSQPSASPPASPEPTAASPQRTAAPERPTAPTLSAVRELLYKLKSSPAGAPARGSTAHAQRPQIDGRWAQLAGAAFLGLLAIGGGYFAATSARRSSVANPPTILVEASPTAANPTPVSLPDQTVSQVLDAPIEGEREDGALATDAAPAGRRVEDYAASMIAGRQGAKVREGPSREAPLIERVEAGSELRVTGRTQTAEHQWYRVVLRDRRSGFVREDVVVRGPAADEDDASGSLMKAGRAGANVRSAPSTDAPLIVRVGAGSDLRAIGRRRVSGRTWFRVVVPDGRVGFVRDDVVQ